MPLDLSKLEELILELHQKEKQLERSKNLKILNNYRKGNYSDKTKKEILLETEEKVYLEISNYFRLVTTSIDDINIAYEIWIKGILPIVITYHGIDIDEWERICSIGDNNSKLQAKLNIIWQNFLENTVQKGLISNEIWEMILEGKKKSNPPAK